MRKFWIVINVCWLWTCGGGGGGSSPTEPEPPQLPTVQNINLEANEDTPKTFTFVGTEPNNLSLTYSVTTQPQNGSVSISGGSGTYTPNANYNGQDTFLYIASSTSGNSNIGTVLINVAQVDDEPSTMDVSATTDEDNAISITLEAEEYDGDNIEFQVRNNPSNGSVTISGTTATYTPNPNWFGTDTFNFEAVDSSAKSVLNVATATITVNPINDAPTIENIVSSRISSSGQISIQLEANDVENDQIEFQIVNSPSHGSYEINNNVLLYTSTDGGREKLIYKAYDGYEYSDEAEIDIIKYTTFGTTGNDYMNRGFVLNNDFIFDYLSSENGNVQSYVTSVDQNLSENWTLTLSGTGNGKSFIDKNDNLYMTSTHDDIKTLYKINNTGNIIWSKNISNFDIRAINSSGNFLSIRNKENNNICDTDGIVLTLLDENLNIIWESQFRDFSNSEYNCFNVQEVKETNDGSYIISFIEYKSRVAVYAAVVVKLDSQGKIIWTYEWDESGDQGLYKLLETESNDFILVGTSNYQHYILKLDSEANYVWSQESGWSTYSYGNVLYDVTDTSDGYMAIGYSRPPSEGGLRKMILNKYDYNGNFLWNKIYNIDNSENGYGRSVNYINNEIVLAGYMKIPDRNNEIVLIKIDSEGNRIF